MKKIESEPGIKYENLCNDDLDLIKSKNLYVFSPHAMVHSIGPAFNKSISRFIKENGNIEIKETVFFIFCYCWAIEIGAKLKTDRANEISEQIREEFLRIALSMYNEYEESPMQEKQKTRSFAKRLMYELEILLEDHVMNKTSIDWKIVRQICELIYGDQRDIQKALKLYLFGMPLILGISFGHTQFFVVENDDIDNESLGK